MYFPYSEKAIPHRIPVSLGPILMYFDVLHFYVARIGVGTICIVRLNFPAGRLCDTAEPKVHLHGEK